MKRRSKCVQLSPVEFPAFKGERHYMIPFYKSKPLPAYLKRWQRTVDAMLSAVIVPPDQRLYLMIDEAFVQAGTAHRRPGPHIDGNWVEHPSEHTAHSTGRPLKPETLLLASSVSGCVGYSGPYSGPIGIGGDVSHLVLSKMKKIRLEAGYCYAGNVEFVHESIPLEADASRTLVRINVPGHEL